MHKNLLDKIAFLALPLWELDDYVQFIREVANVVFEVTRGSKPYILRLTDSEINTKNQLESELDWIQYLASKAVLVSKPVQSTNDKLVEVLNADGKKFYASLFEKAPGKKVNYATDFTPELHCLWGNFLGKMHRFTKNYIPSPGIQNRPQWYEVDEIENFAAYVPRSDTKAWREYNDLISWLHELPQDRDSFGLIHADFYNNFFVYGDTITLFDFDDCHYNWFIYDLAVSLVQVAIKSDEENLDLDINQFRANMIEAYLLENHLDDIWLKRLDVFMRLRIISTYVWCNKQRPYYERNQRLKEWCTFAQEWCKHTFDVRVQLV